MLQLLFKKWWVVLLQGILLILLSVFIFRNPETVFTSISIWIGLFILASGVLGLLSALGPDENEHRGLLILWSALTAVFGFLLLTNLLATMSVLTLLFGIWMLVGGLRLTVAGWSLKDASTMGWIVTLAGVFSVVTACMVMFNLGAAAVGVSVLLGVQVLFAGIALIVFSFIKKAARSAVRSKINSI